MGVRWIGGMGVVEVEGEFGVYFVGSIDFFRVNFWDE